MPAPPKKRPSATTKNPPMLSQEFFIQNHADIFSCATIVIIIGMMAQVTNRFAAPFVALTNNVTTAEELQLDPSRPIEYVSGWKDACTVVFYVMVCIIIHQVIQEYLVDKLTRRMHLSKLRTSRFSESAQLIGFYLVAFVWSVDLAISKGYITKYSTIWDNYPHARMDFAEKFFMILQIAHWLHTYAELYFQKVKKEDIPNRLVYQTINLVAVILAYVTNFHRLFTVLMVAESAVQLVFHSAKLLHYADKNRIANPLFLAYNVMFVLARVLTVVLGGYVMLYALKPSQVSTVDLQQGNFNTPFVKVVLFALVVIVNFWMLVRFVQFHFRRTRERKEAAAQRRRLAQERRSKGGPASRSASSSDDETQNQSQPESSPASANLRSRVKAKKAEL
ncbi:translocating chain-associated membrane protein 1-like [Paramacrobiotus metropolitanus]|uniref:translocating chain-associated membrane protein 1-like n=1 Tax=Paramacrobiotus metropolitanus TaxID=2943436 RepID=UPI002445E46C|nr:translocating chain-associated membrane protein 1-like [Paramacrobiotus metropolitanus]XP_055345473.1 translocating chain-associated membrane protein 1-like [Paramacrobiotus metropolitanus]